MNMARLVVGGSVLPTLIVVIIQQRQSSEALDEIHSSLCWHVIEPVAVIQLHAQCSESDFFPYKACGIQTPFQVNFSLVTLLSGSISSAIASCMANVAERITL